MFVSSDEIKLLPKVELHLHLDCSLSYDVVKKIDPSITLDDYKENFIAPGKCSDLNVYLSKTTASLKLMQTEEHLRWVTRDVYEQLEADNVIYAEIRFAPLLHIQQGLTPQQVVEIIIDEARTAKKQTGIKGGLILCTLRHFNNEQSNDTVRLVNKYFNQGVVGFDIASDEAGYPIDAHVEAFQFAKEHNIPCTAHAGEAKGPESVWETLQYFYPSRIGHGVRSIEDEDLIDFIKEKNIHLEICPTSNIQTNIYPSISSHPVDRFYKSKLSLSINTDGRTISDTTCNEEYSKLIDNFSWTKKHFLYCNLQGMKAAFTSEDTRNDISKQLIEAYS